MAALKEDPTFNQLVKFQLRALEGDLLRIKPLDTTGFSCIAYQRMGLSNLLRALDNLITSGKDAREQMSSDYEPPTLHAV